MKKVVGVVTEEEKTVIKKLNTHKNSLEELLLVLPKDDELYNTAMADMNETIKNIKSGGINLMTNIIGRKANVTGKYCLILMK